MTSKNDILRVGVIGPGGAGRGNTLGFATRPDAEVVAAVDTHEASLDALESALQEQVDGYKANSVNRYLGEYEFVEMLNHEDLDIVGVFSPHSLHDIHVKYALRAGCHVIVEKPMANVVGDAIAVTKIAMGSGLHLVGGYQRHYEDTIWQPGAQSLKDASETSRNLKSIWHSAGVRVDGEEIHASPAVDSPTTQEATFKIYSYG